MVGHTENDDVVATWTDSESEIDKLFLQARENHEGNLREER